ncbi:MAG: hypothetical protein H2056_00420 [Sphingopyxis sp.]|nr:hypothetical protein [Sphingopyxis sp.]
MDMVQLSADFQAVKLVLVEGSGLAKDALHVHFGLAVFVAARLLWRWRYGWAVAWLAALCVALGGEWLDLRGEALIGALQPDSAHWHDVWNTMFWPTVLALLGRWLQPTPTSPREASADERTDGGGE